MSKPFVWILISVGVAGVLCVCGTSWVIEIPFYLLVGWALHSFHLMHETQVDWPSVATVAVVLPLFSVGIHAFCRWFYSSRHPGQSWAWRWSLTVTAVLVLAFIAGIAAVGITHQATWMATSKVPLLQGGRAAAGQAQATNNLKQMGLAADSYHDANHHLPPGSTFDAQGRGLHGWQTFLLPYLDQNHLFQRIDLQQPWNAPGNAEVMKEHLYVFQSPLVERSADEFALSHFAGNVHVLGMKPLALAEITDGTSTTMLMGDISQNFKPWGMPGNWRDPALGLHTSPDGFGGPHAKVSLIAMCDGTVRSVRHDISPEVMKAIATPRGGEKVDPEALDR